jgi:uncharacterized membrane protein YfcA
VLDSPLDWSLAVAAAFFIGVAKAGFTGTSLLAIAIFTGLFGARQQAGVALPLMILADLLVYPAFRRHGSWRDVWKLLPATLVGVVGGWWLMGRIDDGVAKKIIGFMILGLLFLQVLRYVRPVLLQRIADHHAFGTGAGVAAGVTTMLANAAGPVFQLYFLSRAMPKMEMVGIGARFFLLVNLLKLPLNQNLGLIRWETLLFNLWVAPGVVAGVWLGKQWLHRIPQKVFEWMIIGFAMVAAIRMLLG